MLLIRKEGRGSRRDLGTVRFSEKPPLGSAGSETGKKKNRDSISDHNTWLEREEIVLKALRQKKSEHAGPGTLDSEEPRRGEVDKIVALFSAEGRLKMFLHNAKLHVSKKTQKTQKKKTPGNHIFVVCNARLGERRSRTEIREKIKKIKGDLPTAREKLLGHGSIASTLKEVRIQSTLGGGTHC